MLDTLVPDVCCYSECCFHSGIRENLSSLRPRSSSRPRVGEVIWLRASGSPNSPHPQPICVPMANHCSSTATSIALQAAVHSVLRPAENTLQSHGCKPSYRELSRRICIGVLQTSAISNGDTFGSFDLFIHHLQEVPYLFTSSDELQFILSLGVQHEALDGLRSYKERSASWSDAHRIIPIRPIHPSIA